MNRILIISFAFVVMLIATSWDRRTRDYTVMVVDKNDIIDANAMLDPPEKYCQLLKIDLATRELVANHMRSKNYKLKAGKQIFVKNNPTFKELVFDNFKFEVIA